jgi:hypothetical protein
MLPIYEIRAKKNKNFLFVQSVAVQNDILGQPKNFRMKVKVISELRTRCFII